MKGYHFCIMLILIAFCIGCGDKLSDKGESINTIVNVERYDRIESSYLTTGDFSVFRNMNIRYPIQTRTLVEDVLQIGAIDLPETNRMFLELFQDSVLKDIVTEVKRQYESMDDINDELTNAFKYLKERMPMLEIPYVYSQIGALDQSITVNGNIIGISLDKYLGEDYPLYKKYYSEQQRKTMTREMIVPDCLSFYLISLNPVKFRNSLADINIQEKRIFMAKVQWIVNEVMGKTFFEDPEVKLVDKYMKLNKQTSYEELLYCTKRSDLEK